MTQNSKPKGLDRADDFYAELLAAHEGLSKEESDAFNARLILVLANEIGDYQRLAEVLASVRLKDSMKG